MKEILIIIITVLFGANLIANHKGIYPNKHMYSIIKGCLVIVALIGAFTIVDNTHTTTNSKKYSLANTDEVEELKDDTPIYVGLCHTCDDVYLSTSEEDLKHHTEETGHDMTINKTNVSDYKCMKSGYVTKLNQGRGSMKYLPYE